MSKQKIIAIVVVLAAIALGAYLFIYKDGKFSKSDTPSASSIGENPIDKSGLTEEYISPDFGFSFRYPADFSSSELEEENGVTVLLQKSDAREGFQIFISEFDEPFDPAQGKPGPITPERVKKDLPDTVIREPLQVLIGEKKDIPALIFFSKHESLGDVREVWFVVDGFLYQLTAYADMDNFIGPILETLRFE